MTDPAAIQGVEQLMLRQVATELVKSALPEASGAAGGAYHDMFATVLADAVAAATPAQETEGRRA